MNKVLFEYFPPIPSKQWKQKIQYLLHGKSYQDLVHISKEGISTLPFYTKEDLDKRISFNFSKKKTQATFFSIVSNEAKANSEAIEAIKSGCNSILFAIFSAKVDLKTLTKNINCNITFLCYFLDSNFGDSEFLQSKKITILWDLLGKISKTGNWYNSSNTDASILKKCFSNTGNTLNINSALFHNSGANIVQQLSYSICQLIEYYKISEEVKAKEIFYTLSVGSDFFMEIAKIKAFRILHQCISENYNADSNCILLLQKSKRTLSSLSNTFNIAHSQLENQIAILGGVDQILSTPKNFIFYKEDLTSPKENIKKLIKNINNENTIEDTIYIEKLTQQILEKSISLIETIQKGGGYINQLKKGTIQQKIEDNSNLEITNFNTSSLGEDFKSKTPLCFPFLKYKKRKVLWKPIIEKQIRQSYEQPIWEDYFNE